MSKNKSKQSLLSFGLQMVVPGAVLTTAAGYGLDSANTALNSAGTALETTSSALTAFGGASMLGLGAAFATNVVARRFFPDFHQKHQKTLGNIMSFCGLATNALIISQ